MHTLGYNFKPWTNAKAIADGPSILDYVREAAGEHNVNKHIQFNRRVIAANWSTSEARWTLTIQHTDTEKVSHKTCNFLSVCAGYYNYKQGHTPDFIGRDAFSGKIIHPQFWPNNLDYADKRVVVIGSGATAVTLIPELAKKARAVTMLQRTPTYMAALPDHDIIANFLRIILPDKTAYKITRWKNIAIQQFFYRRARANPKRTKKNLLKIARKRLGPDYDIDTHLTPDYDPWDQRLCLVPNGDLFDTIKAGKASIVTDHVDHFTSTGITLKSGNTLDADIIITATGLEVVVMGEMEVKVDGKIIHAPDTFGYKGLMFSGIPNLVSVFGYTNASWTLRADLISDYVCRLVNHLEESGYQQAVPHPPKGMKANDWLEFQPGYIKRVLHKMPKQGDRDPWRNKQDYNLDKKALGEAPIDDGHIEFSNPKIAEKAPTLKVAAE